jgi:hypothetical protein
MSYFDRQKKTEVIVDSSPVGLGFILVRGNESEQKSVVACASKTLKAVEQRYSQTEREALAIVWSCELSLSVNSFLSLYRAVLSGLFAFTKFNHLPFEIVCLRNR